MIDPTEKTVKMYVSPSVTKAVTCSILATQLFDVCEYQAFNLWCGAQ